MIAVNLRGGGGGGVRKSSFGTSYIFQLVFVPCFLIFFCSLVWGVLIPALESVRKAMS